MSNLVILVFFLLALAGCHVALHFWRPRKQPHVGVLVGISLAISLLIWMAFFKPSTYQGGIEIENGCGVYRGGMDAC